MGLEIIPVKITESVSLPNKPNVKVSVTLELPTSSLLPRDQAENCMAILFAPFAQNLARITMSMILLMADREEAFLKAQDIVHKNLENAAEEIERLRDSAG